MARNDIDAELKALQDKAKTLKARKVTQLGELVTATGADALDAETLAGVLLAAIDQKQSEAREAWRQRGAAFFQRRPSRKSAGQTPGDDAGAASDSSGHGAG